MRSHHLVFAWALAALAGAIGSARLPAGAAAPAPAATAPPATPAPFGQLKWREVGPALAGGRTTAVVGSARNPFLYYLGTAAGGVWKSGNGGATWSPVFDKQSVASIGAFALDPNNDEVVWAGTGETNPRNDVTYGGGVYKSADGGKTWTDMGLDDTLQISSIVVDPRDSNVVVVGALGDFFADSQARGIYRTTDGGKTWTKTLYVGPRSGVSDVAADPRNPSVLYAGVWQFRRMPWTFESGGPDDGLYKSADGGATWTKLAGDGLPAPPMGRIGLAVAPSNPKRVYALIESAAGVLWRSDDAGATWSLVSKDTLADQRPFYFTHLRVDPANAEHVYAVSEMLSQSKDGGRTFKDAADGVHVDFHAMWIAPNDPKRMIAGEDGGYALSVDGGEHWSFSANLAIGQVYHVGYDDRTPYSVCAALQDNNAYCGPSNSLDGSGITNAAWQRVSGGDGVWAWPDPADANVVWVDSQDGNLSVFDRTTLRRTGVTPYEGLSIEGFDPSKARYRFNWNSPIAFSPWDPGTTWFGGNVIFQTRDRGRTWTTISPDLTKNDKAHQQPSGGPITHDVSGAEYTDTILDIEPSLLRRGEIWAGTDDGVVQLTRDGGAHWRDVTPPSAPDGRFENVAPSPLVAGTAYAVDDRHLVGDRAPHAYVTHDWGATWQAIDAGLPADQPARSIRPDSRDPHLVYAGLERSIWASWDGGAHWRSLQLNLPPVPVYDIRVQPRWNDVLIATHGRALWILDSAASLQGAAAAQAAGPVLFAPRPAYEFYLHSNAEDAYTNYAAKNPPEGAIVDFYQAAPAKAAPSVQILDATGKVVRTVAGTHKVRGKEEPYVTNDAGINRFVWDLRTDGPVRWMGAAREEYRGPKTGLAVIPGTYTVRLTLDGHTMTQAFDVRQDPRLHYTQAELVAAHAFYARELELYSNVNRALNRVDGVIASATHELSSTPAPSADLSAKLQAALAGARAVRSDLTADYHNDEDSIQRPGKLREDIEDFAGGYRTGPPSAATRAYASRANAEYTAVMARVSAFFAGDVSTADAALKAAGRKPLTNDPSPPEPAPSPSPES